MNLASALPGIGDAVGGAKIATGAIRGGLAVEKNALRAGLGAATVAGPAGLADDLLKWSHNVKPKAGFSDVFIHSDPKAFHVVHNGKWVQMDHRAVAGWVKLNGIQGNLRLISCEAGQSRLGQNLANKLGVTVEAATTKVGIGYAPGDPILLDGGMWKIFMPGIGK